MNRQSTSGILAGLAIAAFISTGCNDAPKGKVEVSGLITWNGAPLENGYISVVPVDGRATAESGKIENGKYSLYAHPGMSKVRIQATKQDGFNQGMNQPNLVQFIPEKYNATTELTLDVQPDNDGEHDFALVGDDSK